MIRYTYHHKNTPIHKLNPLCKLAWIGCVFLLALLFDHPLYLFLIFLSTLPLILAARVWREWASLMKFSLFLCLLVIAINALISNQGTHVLYQAPFQIPVIGAPRMTLEGILCGVGNSLRLLAIISAFTLLTFTIHPDDLMSVMIKARLPHKSVMVASLSTKFVPTLIADAHRITDVQRTRGLEFERGGPVQKARNYLAIAIPLLSNSLDRAVQVAEAMESRAFGSGKNRILYRELKITRFDGITLAAALLPLALGISMFCLGEGEYQYYPVAQGPGLTGPQWVMLLILVLLINTLLMLAPLARRINLDQNR